MYHTILILPLCLALLASAARVPTKTKVEPEHNAKHATNCFPALGFVMPTATPPNSHLSTWWCDPSTEYAFLGFSYEVTACVYFMSIFFPAFRITAIFEGQSRSTLISEFKDIRNHFHSRYVRLYGFCDRDNF